MFDEIFADSICSAHFAACGLDLPAQMVLPRVLDLGVGAVYLWDLPHVFWGCFRLIISPILDLYSTEIVEEPL